MGVTGILARWTKAARAIRRRIESMLLGLRRWSRSTQARFYAMDDPLEAAIFLNAGGVAERAGGVGGELDQKTRKPLIILLARPLLSNIVF